MLDPEKQGVFLKDHARRSDFLASAYAAEGVDRQSRGLDARDRWHQPHGLESDHNIVLEVLADTMRIWKDTEHRKQRINSRTNTDQTVGLLTVKLVEGSLTSLNSNKEGRGAPSRR